MNPILFRSRNYPGAVLNRFGVAIYKGRQLEATQRDNIRREAAAAGWTLQPSKNPDEGLLYTPPEAPDDGKSSE